MAAASRPSVSAQALLPSLPSSRTCCVPSTSCPVASSLKGRPLKLGRIAKSNRHLGSAKRFQIFASTEGGKSSTVTTTESASGDRDSDVDTLVETISFGQLCDEFECISSPAVERTARQLARDILDLKESNRLLSCFAVAVKYKDPLRSFNGRDKYRRVSWMSTVLESPVSSVYKMEMQSSSELIIKWKVKGKIRIPPASILGQELTLIILSKFKMNQITGQVTEHVDEWDFSQTSPLSAVFFWSSRAAWSITELVNDGKEALDSIGQKFSSENENGNIYADPTDPRKFFQQINPNRDLYQIGFFIALVYLLVQTLRLII